MSTRAHIELHDFGTDDSQIIRLYHHYDGYPSWMVLELVCRLWTAREAILSARIGGPHMWDCERVGALFIAQSSDPTDTYRGSIPRFVPSACWHDDIEYLYQVHLREPWQWVIKGFHIVGERTRGGLEHVGTWQYKDKVLSLTDDLHGTQTFPNPFADIARDGTE